MNKKIFFMIIIFFLILGNMHPVNADETKNIEDVVEVLEMYNITKERIEQELENVYQTVLENPETINKVLEDSYNKYPQLRFLKDLNVEFKTFETGRSNSQKALGISYSYTQDPIKHIFMQKGANKIGSSISFDCSGNIAFDKQANPSDFLSSGFSTHFFMNFGGAVEADSTYYDHLNSLEDKLVLIVNQEQLDNSKIWKEFLHYTSKNLTNQTYLDYSLNFGLESDQQFINKQYFYGVSVGFDYKPWNKKSFLARWNIFDLPFAAIRWLSYNDEKFNTRRSSFPTLLMGLDYVDPREDEARQAIDSDLSGYTRFKGEISFKTPLIISENSMYFESNVRYFKELDPSYQIEKEEMDEFTLLSFGLTATNGMFVRYTTGKLPFDAISDETYELGFQSSF